jgi:hypothetical protein
MTLRRIAIASTLPMVIAALFLGAQACSSSNEPTATVGTCGGDPFASNGSNGVKVSKADACARFVFALQKQGEALKCGFSADTLPKCPNILDDLEAAQIATHPGLCIDGYSAGGVTNCECRIATYTSCADFSDTSKRCIFTLLPAPAGTTCGGDAGTDSGGSDSGSDTFETSPLDDAAADAGSGG